MSFAQIFTNITPSTITVDSVNHTYTGTLSSSTYSGYKLAANNNKIVSSGNHTLSGYTGNNIILAITGNTVNVTNSKTSTNRITELQNFIKSNWSKVATYIGLAKTWPVYADVKSTPITKPAITVELIWIKTETGWSQYVDKWEFTSSVNLKLIFILGSEYKEYVCNINPLKYTLIL